MVAMSNYLRARHILNPSKIVEIPIAWLDTPLADVYILVEDGADCSTCGENALVIETPVVDEAPVKQTRSSKTNPVVNDEDEATNE